VPFYQYEPVGKSCTFCRRGFEQFQQMSDRALTKCPECGKRCRRVPASIGRPTTPFLSKSNLEKKGLTKLVKNRDGKYEVGK
jgi:putative FmdB family regulatory protein